MQLNCGGLIKVRKQKNEGIQQDHGTGRDGTGRDRTGIVPADDIYNGSRTGPEEIDGTGNKFERDGIPSRLSREI